MVMQIICIHPAQTYTVTPSPTNPDTSGRERNREEGVREVMMKVYSPERQLEHNVAGQEKTVTEGALP